MEEAKLLLSRLKIPIVFEGAIRTCCLINISSPSGHASTKPIFHCRPPCLGPAKYMMFYAKGAILTFL